jgi:hypothetical protein
MHIDIYDDREAGLALDFTPPVNPEIVQEVKAGKKGAVLANW